MQVSQMCPTSATGPWTQQNYLLWQKSICQKPETTKTWIRNCPIWFISQNTWGRSWSGIAAQAVTTYRTVLAYLICCCSLIPLLPMMDLLLASLSRLARVSVADRRTLAKQTESQDLRANLSLTSGLRLETMNASRLVVLSSLYVGNTRLLSFLNIKNKKIKNL